MNKASVVIAAETYFDAPKNDKGGCGQLSCSRRPIPKPKLLQSPRKQLLRSNLPTTTGIWRSSSNEFFVWNYFPLGNSLILSIEILDFVYRTPRPKTCIVLPTMTVLRANGLPHSLVSNDRKSDSPVSNDSVFRSAPSDDSKPARAASVSASIQVLVFAAKPSGLE